MYLKVLGLSVCVLPCSAVLSSLVAVSSVRLPAVGVTHTGALLQPLSTITCRDPPVLSC